MNQVYKKGYKNSCESIRHSEPQTREQAYDAININ